MELYQVDAFADQLFKGNPAAVMVLEKFLPADVMQNIAMENNLAETAFVVPRDEPGQYDLRWFTPGMEIDFCGHATIASAHILATELGHQPPFHFHVIIGELIVGVKDDLYQMDAPITALKAADVTPDMGAAFGQSINEAYWAHKNLLLILESEADVRAAEPDLPLIKTLSEDGVIITARGTDFDCVSRYFAPNALVDEDPVTGSAHAAIGPYWAAKLGQSKLTAYQASQRGGILWIDVGTDRMTISGKAVTYLRGEITL
ncbi:MAG: PhzF family phenazine biosynthesis protein [Hellea sp.]|nr:PhzF family phenazine biosynthesis protein [Hellea sp.]